MKSSINLPREDIQGIILDGYEDKKAAHFVLLQIVDPAKAKKWLQELPIKDSLIDTESNTSINIAFTFSGIEALGLKKDELKDFSTEFSEGMTTEHRQRLLGDIDHQSPEYWDWGGPDKDPVHILLMLYAKDDGLLDEIYKSQIAEFSNNGLNKIQTLPAYSLPENKEHFGFRDGISQPEILGSKKGHSKKGGNVVATGEFLLGYNNEYDRLPPSPQVTNNNILQDGNLGKNGTYLVFRQLGQDVAKFWEFLKEKTKDVQGQPDPTAMVKLAAKMVGRWPSGAPIVTNKDKDNPIDKDKNDFLYRDIDPEGDACPVASHIRRSNPRDDLKGSKEEALEISAHHRILRRGRPYGEPLAKTMDPEEMLQAAADEVQRGLLFLCFNTNISRQFEFIQNTWNNNPKFEGHYNDSDPLMGKMGRDFTQPGIPVRKRVRNLPEFVSMKGGAYFFMPGINAIRYLASLP